VPEPQIAVVTRAYCGDRRRAAADQRRTPRNQAVASRSRSRARHTTRFARRPRARSVSFA
jgi:hypothetical protein